MGVCVRVYISSVVKCQADQRIRIVMLVCSSGPVGHRDVVGGNVKKYILLFNKIYYTGNNLEESSEIPL